MRFSILGPLEIRDDAGRAVQVSRPLHRSALALLLLNAGQPCSSASLATGLWGDEPPKSPDVSLRSCVYGIRKLLPDPALLRTRPSGYLITVGPGELDLHEFRDLAGRGRVARDEGDYKGAAALLGASLSLWRNPSLADVPAVPQRERLLEHRDEARDALADARLALGEHRQLLPELRDAVAADPLREHAWAQLIIALYRSGARTEALAAYGRLRVMLISAYGMEPGPELQDLHRQVLADDPALLITAVPARLEMLASAARTPTTPAPVPVRPEAAPAAPAATTAGTEPPSTADSGSQAREAAWIAGLRPWQPACQLPVAVADFTGRALPLARLLGRMSGKGMAVTVVTGMLGTGKSALAVHAAHLASPGFPDGQLYACLDDVGRPRDPQVVLGELLRGLGVAAGGIPVTRFEREALYRSLLAGRRVLILADGASSAAQVWPLLPGTTGSAVVVTSRARLPDLDGARHIELGDLHPADSVRLLAMISGRDLGDGDQDADRFAETEAGAARSIASSCGHLPLALRIAGTRLADDPDLTVTDLAGLLSDEDRRLDELAVGGASVRTSLGTAADGVSSPARRALARLAVAGSPETPGSAIITLSGDAEAGMVAPELTDAGLLRRVSGNAEHGGTSYRVHPLVRAYAGELLAGASGPCARTGHRELVRQRT